MMLTEPRRRYPRRACPPRLAPPPPPPPLKLYIFFITITFKIIIIITFKIIIALLFFSTLEGVLHAAAAAAVHIIRIHNQCNNAQ